MIYRYIDKKELNSYELDNKRLSYANLFYKDDSLILCNNIAKNWEQLELQENNNYDNICGIDIYQYYIISDSLANRLIEYTNEIIFYHNELDIYVLGVDHFGTSWDYVLTDFKLEKVKDTDTLYKVIKSD